MPVKIHPLKHLVPSSDIADSYISRTIADVEDLDLLKYAQGEQKNVLLFGDTGPGKTAMVMAYAAVTKQPIVTIACNGGIDPNTFWNSIVPDMETGGIKDVDSEVTEVVRHGGILYLDEINFMPPKTTAVFHPLLDARRFITMPGRGNQRVMAHKNLFIIGSYNPGYQGTRPLNAAFKNRFKLKLPIDYSREVESQLVCMPVMLDLADKLRSSRQDGVLETPTSTNMLIEFEEFAIDLGLRFAIDNFVAAFEADERDAVRAVIELHMSDIEWQLEQMKEA